MDLKNKLNQFYQNKVIPENSARQKQKQALLTVINKIENGLKQNAFKNRYGLEFSRVEFVGSEWEGTKVDGPSDFDIVLTFKINENCFKIEKERSGQPFDNARFHIVYSQYGVRDSYSEKVVQNFCDGSRKLNPTKIVEIVRTNAVETTRNKQFHTSISLDIDDMSYKGCAFPVKISTPSVREFKCDFTVAIDIRDGFDMRHMTRLGTDNRGTNLWQQSFSIEEKGEMKRLDNSDNGCRKKVYKIFKYIKKNSARGQPLYGILPYVLKNAIFHLKDKYLNWNEANLAERFKDTLHFLETAFEKRKLTRYFEKSSGGNLLERCADGNIENSARLLREIRVYQQYDNLLR